MSDRLIGAAQVGICRHCQKPLFVTTARCARAYSGGRPIPRPADAPPCPVEDGTLRDLIRPDVRAAGSRT